MKTDRPVDTIGETKPAEPASAFRCFAAIAEVTVVFLLVHISFRAIKHFTVLGQLDVTSGLNFTPGLVMILFTVAILLLCRRSFAVYGLTLTNSGENLKLGLFWGLLLVGGAGLLMLARIRHQAGGPPPTLREGIAYGLACLAGLALFALLVRRQREFLKSVPIGVCAAIVVSLLCSPLVVAWYYHRPAVHTFLTTAWLVIGAGIGEEVFYRGYIQSRSNEAFGRPFRFCGVQFGPGLLTSSLLFGFLHALNSVDYFQGRFTFAWGYGIAAFGVGLLYGCLREISGSVVPGAVTHAVLDVLARLPALVP